MVWAELETKMFFLKQSRTKYCRQIHKIKKIGFSVECFIADFLQYFCKNIKIAYRVVGWISLKSFSNSYFHYLITMLSSFSMVNWNYGKTWKSLQKLFVLSQYLRNFDAFMIYNNSRDHYYWVEIDWSCHCLFVFLDFLLRLLLFILLVAKLFFQEEQLFSIASIYFYKEEHLKIHGGCLISCLQYYPFNVYLPAYFFMIYYTEMV